MSSIAYMMDCKVVPIPGKLYRMWIVRRPPGQEGFMENQNQIWVWPSPLKEDNYKLLDILPDGEVVMFVKRVEFGFLLIGHHDYFGLVNEEPIWFEEYRGEEELG